MGTPDFAVPALHAVAGRCDVAAVVTQPDRGRGRGRAVSPSDVAAAAETLELEIIKADRVNTPEIRTRLAALAPDLFAVVAFGAILKPEVLGIPRLGCINLHGSLLPDFRGASPVQHALLEGRAHTGVTTIWMNEGIDTGDMILQRWAPIAAEDDAGSLSGKLALLGAPLLAESLVMAHEGRAPRVAQDPDAGSYARKMTKVDGALSFEADAVAVWNHQRAVTPWPGATVSIAGQALRIERCVPEHVLDPGVAAGTVTAIDAGGVVVACAPGALRLLDVRPASRPTLRAADWARGARLEPGARFTEHHEVRT